MTYFLGACLAAAHAPLHFTADKCAGRGAEDRTRGAIAPSVDLAPEQRAARGADHQTGRAVAAAAVIPPVAPAPHVARGDAARFIVTPAVVVIAAPPAAIVVVGHGRSGGKGHRSCGNPDKASPEHCGSPLVCWAVNGYPCSGVH